MSGLPAQSQEGTLPFPLLGPAYGSALHMHYLRDLSPQVSSEEVTIILVLHMNKQRLGDAKPEDTELVSSGSDFNSKCSNSKHHAASSCWMAPKSESLTPATPSGPRLSLIWHHSLIHHISHSLCSACSGAGSMFNHG